MTTNYTLTDEEITKLCDYYTMSTQIAEVSNSSTRFDQMDVPLSFADMKTLNATLRMYNISKEEFMNVINRYIAIKEECSE